MVWLPRHMKTAFADITKRLSVCDVVLEVRDARVPLSSANPSLQSVLKKKKHLIVFNKADLAPPVLPSLLKRLHRRAREQSSGQAFPDDSRRNSSLLATAEKIYFTSLRAPSRPKAPRSARQGSSSRGIGELIRDLRSIPKTGDAPNLIMVVGFPNVGKSSLINKMKLTSRGRAAVGATPGVTRATTSFPLNAEESVFVLDTPGIIPPVAKYDGKDEEQARELQVKLAAVSAIPRKNLERFLLVDFIYSLLQDKNPNILNNQMVASLFNRIANDGQNSGAEDKIIDLFSKGMLGSYCLDSHLLYTLSDKEVEH